MATRRQREKTKKRKLVSAKKGADNYISGRGTNYLKIPDNIRQFKPEANKYRLDFFYYVAGKGNPIADEGDGAYERQFFVHKGIGADDEWFLCSAKTFKKPCPICEYLKKKSMDPDLDPDEWKETRNSLGPKERRLYLVKDLNDDDDAVMIYNEAVHTFGRVLYGKIDNADEEDGYDYFASPDEGLTVRVSFKHGERGKWLEVADLELRPRKKQYDPDIIDEMPCLDDMLIETPYERLKKTFLQIDPDDEDNDDDDTEEEKEEEKPARKRKPKTDKKKLPTADEFGIEKGDVVEYDDEECDVVKVSPDGTSLTLEDPDGNKITAIGPNEVKKVSDSSNDDEDDDEELPFEDDEEEKKPSRKSRKSSSKKKEEEEDDDDDEGEDWGNFDDDDDD